MERYHIEEIDLDSKIEESLAELPDKFKESPPKFFPNDLPYAQCGLKVRIISNN